MKNLKRIIAILLIVSMIFTTNGISVFADSMNNIDSSSAKTHNYQQSTDNYCGSDSIKSDKIDENEKEGEESTSIEPSDEETTTIEKTSEEESTLESSSETSIESSESSSETSETSVTNESSNESTNDSSSLIETTTKKQVVDEEKNATVSDAENTNNSENEIGFDTATASDINTTTLFGENENIASSSEMPIREYVDDNDKFLTYIDEDYVAPVADLSKSSLFGADPLPSRYDSREYTNQTTGLSIVPPIRYQNPYGVCWAFASIGMIETSIRKKGLVSTEAGANLSELALAFFVYTLEHYTKRSDIDNLGNVAGNDYHAINYDYFSDPEQATWSECGGNMNNSTKMMSTYLGAVVEDSVTQYSDDGSKNQAMLDIEAHGLPIEYAYRKNAFVPKDIKYINKNNTEAIKHAIMENGSVGFSYYSESNYEYNASLKRSEFKARAFHWEGDGDDKKSYFFSNGRTSTNHAIMIVGWDDSIPKEKFYYGGADPVQDGIDYVHWVYNYRKPPTDSEYQAASRKASQDGAWICRNSWSEDPVYLANGYFYISYDETSFSSNTYSVDAIPASTYKYNYHLDSTGATDSFSPYASNASQFGNIFKVSGEDDAQLLEAVNIGVNSTNAEYDVKIYISDTEMENPTDGTLASTQRCSNTLAGLYTFELDTPVHLAKDTYFSVVVEDVATDGGKLYLFYDCLDDYVGYYYTYNEAKIGQSFFNNKNYGNDYWKDINVSPYAGSWLSSTRQIDGKLYGNNWRIKALSNPDNTAPPPAEGHYVLTKDWFDGSTPGISKDSVESITFIKYRDAVPTGTDVTAWDLPSETHGLKGYTKGNDIFIYAPANVPIKLPADSSFLFSANLSKINYTDNEHLTNRDKFMETPSPVSGSTPTYFEALKIIKGLDKLNTEDVTDMQGMFYNCTSLESADFSFFNTSNVTDMSLMFSNSFADGIPCLDLSSFDTSKVTSFNQTFEGIGVREVDTSSFDTSSAVNMAGMFASFNNPSRLGINTLDLSNFSTNNAVLIVHMISAHNVASVSVASFDTRKVTSFEGLFYDMPRLTELDISNFETDSANDMRWMFNSCTNLVTIKASPSFIARGNTENMFDGCTSLVGGKGTRYEASNPKDGTYARIDQGPTSSAPGYFTEPPIVAYTLPTTWFNLTAIGKAKNQITKITLSKYPTLAPTSYNAIWNIPDSNGLVGYTLGTEIVIYAPEKGTISFPADSSSMFKNFSNLIQIENLRVVDTSNVTNMSSMFEMCQSIESIDLSKFDTSNVTNMSHMFYYCRNMTDINLSSFDTSNVTSFQGMFFFCEYLETLNVSSFDTSSATDMSSMFSNCSALETMNLSNFNTSNVTDMSSMFSGCFSMINIDLTSFDTRKVTTMAQMFYCLNNDVSYTKTIDLSSFDTSNVTSMAQMFYRCARLETIKVSNTFVTTKLTDNMSDLFMFDSCTKLKGGNGTIYDENHVDKLYARIDGLNDLPGYLTSDAVVKVTFDLNGKGTNFTKVFIKGGTITAPTNPTFTGSNFVHWYKEGTSEDTAYDFTQVLPTDAPSTLKLIAKWEAKTYVINYSAGDGATVAPTSFTKTYGTAYTSDLAVPAKTGFTFEGWYTTSALTTVYDKTSDSIYVEGKTDPYYVYAKWTAKTYTINLNAKGGTITGDTSFTKTYGTAYSGTIPTPTKTGFVFGGWFIDDTTFANEYNKSNDNIYVEGTNTYTVFAKWTAKTYTINYIAGTGATVSPTSFTKTYGTAYASDLAVPTKTGYTFINWYKENTFANVYDKSNDDIYVEGQTTPYNIYAKFNANEYTVDYDLVGIGATKPSTITKTYDSPLASGALKAPTNIPAGYEFLGWFRSYDSSTGTYGTEWTGSDDLTSGTTTQTVYAKWKRAVVYNVLMNGVDIGATAVPSKEITGETTYNLPSTSATGYVFGGWYGEAECTTFKGNAGDPITVSAPTTLYAKWTPASYKIYYKNVDGSSITDGEFVTKTYGSNVTLNTTPTKTGYVFNGWFTDNTTFVNAYDGTTDLASTQDDDKNIYAKWTPNQYQVNYDLSGIAATAPATPVTKTYGVALASGVLKDPTGIPSGYTFAGWYKESTFANEWTGSDDLTTGTTAQTIYARWKAKITYNANGHGTAPASVDVYLNDTTILPSISNVTGYTFDTTNSWYDDSDVSTATLIGAAGANYTVTIPKTLYARWNEEEYSITYDRKDGNWTGTAPADKRKYSEAVTLPVAADISKNDGTNDYVFKGWYTVDGSTLTWDETKKVTKIDANTVAPTGGHKFYARWNPAWKITFNMLGYGTKPSDIVAEQGTKVPTSEIPANPTETGYIFSGWYKNYDSSVADFDGKYTNPFNFSTDTVTANMTLYAKWKPITYTISYNANGGTVSPTSDTKTYATNLTLAVPTRTGYDFDAWYKNYDATTKTFSNPYDGASDISIVQGDTITVYAKWIPHQYTVDYNLGTEASGAGAMPPTSTITKTYGENLAVGTLQNPSVIPNGYEFLGWYKEATFTNQWTGNDDLTSDGGVTVYIYAKWKRAVVFSVLYQGNDIGASVPTSIEITGPTDINLPSTTATGYTFGGWYRESELTNLVGNVGDPVNVSVPTTFYAKWTPNQYEITYNTLGGTLPSATTNPFTKTYGVDATLVNPTYEGYDFVGWYSNYNTTTKAYSNPFDGTSDISTDTTGKTIYAKWEPHKYNINYELSGHATAITPTEKTYGVSYIPPTPTGISAGYKFDGWFKESTYTNSYTGDDLTTGTDAQTIYARWKATVTFDANGHGTAPAAVDVILGDSTNLPSITNVTGYTFDVTNSWYDGSDVSTATLIGAAGSSYAVNEPKKLFARWNENNHTITYEKDGGDWVGTYDPVAAGVTSRKYTEEKVLPTSIYIAKTGYTFLGWYKQGDAAKIVITKIAANTDDDVIVVAKWSENTYNITLNRNGGNYVSGYTAPTTRKYTEDKTLPTNDDIKKTGYTLEGWHEQENYSDAAITSIVANTAEHKTFYAKWVPENYLVTLNTNGGTINSGDVTSYTYGTGATLPTDITKVDSVFKGWWTQDGTGGNWGTQVTTISASDTGAKTYYAKWSESFTVTFNLTTGTAPAEANITNKPATQNVESGSAAVKPTVNPQAENFEFVGWYDSTLSTEYNFSAPITATTTIYAKWNSVATHDVTFNLMSGTIHPAALTNITNVPETQYVVNGRKVTKPTDPSSTGYKFVAWYTDDTFATVWNFTSDTVTATKKLYAKWELQKYNIIYMRNDGVWASTFIPITEREYGTAVTLPTDADISKTGYTFAGWFENSDFTGPITSIAANYSDHKTVYASWTKLDTTRIITFNDNYSGATAEQAFTLGDTTDIRTNVFTRQGYTFIRWKDISGNVYLNTNQLTGDIVLYAEWQKNPTPAPTPQPSDSRGSSSDSGSSRGVGPIPQNQIDQPNIPSQQGTIQQVEVSTSKSDQIVVSGNTASWTYDPVNNSWKLSALDLGGVPTNASNGFFILSQVSIVIENNQAVTKTTSDTYYFDQKGNMVTGWVKTNDSKWYFFNNEKTIDEGKLCIGWKKIDGSWYFFSSNDGSMMTNTTTSDGYKLGSDGRWIQ